MDIGGCAWDASSKASKVPWPIGFASSGRSALAVLELPGWELGREISRFLSFEDTIVMVRCPLVQIDITSTVRDDAAACRVALQRQHTLAADFVFLLQVL